MPEDHVIDVSQQRTMDQTVALNRRFGNKRELWTYLYHYRVSDP